MKRVKVKVSKNDLGGEDLTGIFNQMLGMDRPSFDVVRPKYEFILAKLRVIKNIVGDANIKIFKVSGADPEHLAQVDKFVEDLTEYLASVPSVEEELKNPCDEIIDAYLAFKASDLANRMMVTCRNLVDYRAQLSRVDITTITKMPCAVFKPLAFSDLNFKEIDPLLDDGARRYLTMFLNIILECTHEIYKKITSPDIDVQEFSRIIIAAIANIKKQVPRCEQAFRKIEESVGLLEGNFDGYYRDFVRSKNPISIIDGFIGDVSKSADASPQVVRQFKRVIAFFKKQMQGKINDPRVSKMFDVLNANPLFSGVGE